MDTSGKIVLGIAGLAVLAMIGLVAQQTEEREARHAEDAALEHRRKFGPEYLSSEHSASEFARLATEALGVPVYPIWNVPKQRVIRKIGEPARVRRRQIGDLDAVYLWYYPCTDGTVVFHVKGMIYDQTGDVLATGYDIL